MTNKPEIRPERLASIKSQVQFGARIDPKAGADLIDEIERLRALLDAPAAPPVVVATVRHIKTENSERYEGVIRASAVIEGLVAEGTQLCIAPSQCTVPPEGLTCSRRAGHDGPCAASPVAD